MAYRSPSAASLAASSSDLEFQPPKDLEDHLGGESGDALVHWQRKPSGAICIISMEGVPLGGDGTSQPEPGHDEESGPGTMAHSASQLDAMSSQM